jgi:osmotically-inducible protein OsmY
MKRTKTMTKTTALFAASVFGGSAALAGGDYYKGAYPESEQSQKMESQRIDRVRTNSIGSGYASDGGYRQSVKVGPANGDYYQGANPNAR